jgi:hypothetical protein
MSVPHRRKVPVSRKKAGDDTKKKQPVHHSGLTHVAPPLAVIDTPHEKYIGAINVFVDTPTRYETQNLWDAVDDLVFDM